MCIVSLIPCRYEVAGGLHGFTAKAELKSEFPTNPYFNYIEAEVYCKISDEQALRLALRHNMNGHFIHKVTFRDIVSPCIQDSWVQVRLAVLHAN